MRDHSNMRTSIAGASLLAAALAVSGCAGAGGSCVISSTAQAGYLVCEDYQGTEFNHSAGQTACDAAGGAYSSDTCDQSAALGFCEVAVNSAQQYSFTYQPSGSASASQTVLASACGTAGGVYSAPAK